MRPTRPFRGRLPRRLVMVTAAIASTLAITPAAAAAQDPAPRERQGRAQPAQVPAAERPQRPPVPLEARTDTAPALRPPPVTPPPPAPARSASQRATRTPDASPVAPLTRVAPPAAPVATDTATIGASARIAPPARGVANPPRRALPAEPALMRSAAPPSDPQEGTAVQCRDGTQLGAGATAAACASRGGAAVVHPQSPPPPPPPARRGNP